MLRRMDFERIGRETGFDLDLLEKSYNLTRVLHEIQTNEILQQNLTLKGGTALNFLYLDIPRLSIDIDFNYTGELSRDGMIEARPLIERAIMKTGEELGFKIKASGRSYILSRYSLKYTTVRNTKDHVKIEINYLDRLPIDRTPVKLFPSIFPDVSDFPVTTYSLDEITAQKIKACIERTEPRDLYDLSRLSNEKIEFEKVKRIAAVYYCMCDKKITDELIKNKEGYGLEKLKQELQQFLRVGSSFDAGSVRENAMIFLKQILSFDRQEQEFIDAFFNRGKIVPEILFQDKASIKQHPALLNKLRKEE